MTRYALPQLVIAAVGVVVLLILAPVAAATGWRVAFLTVGGPILGAVLMLAIAVLTGARWPAFAPIAAAAPIVVIAAIGIGVVQLAAPPPAHLGFWQQPIAVGIRAVVAAAVIAWLGARVARGAGVTLVAIGLAIYTALVTLIGSDWMLGGDPGHSVSAIGMILFVEQIGGACALVLVLGWGDERFLHDMGKMLAACGLGLSYLVFMDFLILWYGDLPSRIGWYTVRSTLPMELIAGASLVLGLFVPIGAQALIGGRDGQRIAGASALVALALLNLWWTHAGLIGFVAACVAGWLIAAAAILVARRRRAHG